MDLDRITALLNAELEADIVRPPGLANANALPLPLRSFYRAANGFETPFLSIFPADRVQAGFERGWMCFGHDGYFSYCLSSETGIDLWDHAVGTAPEVAYRTVEALLLSTYQQRVETSSEPGCVVLTSISPHASTASVVAALKRICPGSSAGVLASLRRLPLRIDCSREVGLAVVRILTGLGAHCRLALAHSG